MSDAFEVSRSHLAKYLRVKAPAATRRMIEQDLWRNIIAERYATDSAELGGLALKRGAAETKSAVDAVARFMLTDELLWPEVNRVEPPKAAEERRRELKPAHQDEPPQEPRQAARRQLRDRWHPPEWTEERIRAWEKEQDAQSRSASPPSESESSAMGLNWMWILGSLVILLLIALAVYLIRR